MAWRRNGRNLLLLTTTWFYFLVFAQFALLHQVERLCTPLELKWVLGSMTLCGVAGALLAGARCGGSGLRWWIGSAQALAFLAAILAGHAGSSAGLWLPAALTGLALGVLTVAALAWVAERSIRLEAGVLVGGATGLAYLLANLPWFFQATPMRQGNVAAAAVCLGSIALFEGRRCTRKLNVRAPAEPSGKWQLWLAILLFAGLVWVDSAAFAWMQSLRSLRDAVWGEGLHLWSIGIVHLFAALATGYLLSIGRSVGVICLIGFAALLTGYAMVIALDLGLPGVWVYMSGVSMYSTALVAYPLLTQPEGSVARSAGRLFACAGWAASAMGIGMVEDLGRMPAVAWLVVAVLVIALPGSLQQGRCV